MICRLFHGGPDTEPAVKPYSYEDVIAALNRIQPHDWNSFFTERLDSLDASAPQGRVKNSGWQLVFSDVTNLDISYREANYKWTDLSFSIGLILKEDGSVKDLIPGTAAANAGIAPRHEVGGCVWPAMGRRSAAADHFPPDKVGK